VMDQLVRYVRTDVIALLRRLKSSQIVVKSKIVPTEGADSDLSLHQ